MGLEGKTALVTGGASGFGAGIARQFHAEGARVMIADIDPEAAEAMAAVLGTRHVTVDVGDDASVAAMAAVALAEFGHLDILVNNAGIPDAQRATKMSIELIDNVLGTNVRAPWILATEFAKRRLEAKRPGRIINIASMAAYSYRGEGAALYSVSKAAVVRMTEALAVEWSKFHINVNAIAPGAFASEMMDGMLERMGDISQHMPRRRIGDPAQLDSTLLYLCSPASDAVTGTSIKVDDGQGGR